MPRYEYKVVPAPMRGQKVKGIRATQERFAHTLSAMMNEMAAQGWEYQRAETLPCEERPGLFARKQTSYQNMLVFRRLVEAAAHTASVAPPPRAAVHVTERVPPEPGLAVVPDAPTPAAMAASLTPSAVEGTAPRLAPVAPAQRLRREDPAPARPGGTRMEPGAPGHRGE
ncbi:DUF4177 domain-containing protein [Plastorhodobacter daqingensis]|uniref:DUF4177 domain-containing protein n=1 Tax=Plastorhodobacter daqingensis TaxID=1387281 RepID=A0ABW2UKT4_9RHOB